MGLDSWKHLRKPMRLSRYEDAEAIEPGWNPCVLCHHHRAREWSMVALDPHNLPRQCGRIQERTRSKVFHGSRVSEGLQMDFSERAAQLDRYTGHWHELFALTNNMTGGKYQDNRGAVDASSFASLASIPTSRSSCFILRYLSSESHISCATQIAFNIALRSVCAAKSASTCTTL